MVVLAILQPETCGNCHDTVVDLLIVLYVALLLYESAQSVRCNQINKTFNGFCVILLKKR